MSPINPRMLRFTCCLLFLIPLQSFAIAQNAKPQNHKDLLIRSAERDVHELLDAISTFDNGIYNHIFAKGMMASGSKTHSKLQQIISDERVRKIYAELKAMPRSEAAALVGRSFDDAIQQKKSGKASWGSSYGLHAKLWLSFEFEDIQSYRKHYNEWNDWVLNGLRQKRYYNKEISLSKDEQRSTYIKNAGPELLMYLNLELLAQSETGALDDSSEFARILKDEGISTSSLAMFESAVLPYDFDWSTDDVSESAIGNFRMIPTWAGGLDLVTGDEKLLLKSKIRNLVDPKGFGERVHDILNDSLYSILKPNIPGLSEIAKKVGIDIRDGTSLKFIGSQTAHTATRRSTQRYWETSTKRPTKFYFMAAIDELYQATPKAEREEWSKLVDEVHTWLSEIPEKGLEIDSRKVIEWPAEYAEEESPLRIRLVLKNTVAFTGTLKQKEDGKQLDVAKEQSANKEQRDK